MKDPVFRDVWTNPHDPLPQFFQEFLFSNIDCLPVQQEPTLCEQYAWNHKHPFHFWLGHACFLCLGDPFERNSKIWYLVSGSYWKHQLSSPVITRSINYVSASTCSSRSAQILNRASCCSSMRFLGTILAQIFLSPNSSISIKRTVSRFMFNLSAITWIGSNKFCVVNFHAVNDRPLRCSFSTKFLPSENILCQRMAGALDIASSLKTFWSFPCVVMTLSPSLTQKRDTAARCSVLPFPREGSQTSPYTLYAFFWVNPRRLKFICRRFGTLCLFHLHRQVGACRMN